jgi:hypothetical protein
MTLSTTDPIHFFGKKSRYKKYINKKDNPTVKSKTKPVAKALIKLSTDNWASLADQTIKVNRITKHKAIYIQSSIQAEAYLLLCTTDQALLKNDFLSAM